MALAAYAPRVAFFDNNGDPLSGGKVYFYQPGTTTPKDTYTTAAASTPNANPVILNSRGEAAIYLDGTYKVRLETSASVLIYEEDNFTQASLTGLGVSAFMQTVLDDTTSTAAQTTLGGTTVGRAVFTAANAAAAKTATETPQPPGSYTPIRTGGSLVDNVTFLPSANTTAGIQDAITAAAAAGGGEVLLENTDYNLTGGLNITSSNIRIRGLGKARLIAPASGGANLISAVGTVLTSTTLSANMAVQAISATVTTATNFQVGDMIYFTKTSGSIFYGFPALVTNKSGSVISFTPPAPVGILTSDTHTVVPITPKRNIVIENVRFDGNGNTSLLRGVFAQALLGCTLKDLRFENFVGASAAYVDQGIATKVENIDLYNCGTSSESDITLRAQTQMQASGITSRKSSGFGPQIDYANYCDVRGVSSYKSNGRGVKFAGCLLSKFTQIEGHDSTSTGIAISLGTDSCHFDQLVAMSNRGGSGGNDVGIWLSDQSNANNTITNVKAFNNQTTDITAFTSDTGNYIHGDWTNENFQTTNLVAIRDTSGLHELRRGSAPSFSAHKNGTDQTGITSATWTKLTFGTEDWDLGAQYDAGNSRILPTVPCKMRVSATAACTAGQVDGATFNIALYKNGTEVKRNSSHFGNAADLGATVTALIDFNGSTDFVEVFVNIGGAGSKTISGSTVGSYFQGERIQ